ncbi:hypothetical protein AKJ16_DCAP07041 [Drosera capensis]
MSARSESLALIVIPSSSLKLWLFVCWVVVRIHLRFSAVSMGLRPERTCCGVECFGGFHINRFSSLSSGENP